MLLKEFVQEVQKEIDLLPKPVQLSQEEKIRQALSFLHSTAKVKSLAEHPVILQESEELFEQLVELLDRYANSEETATSETLSPFRKLLTNRWRELKDHKMSSDYLYACRQTLAHKAYTILSQQLETVLNENPAHYEMVIPAISPSLKLG